MNILHVNALMLSQILILQVDNVILGLPCCSSYYGYYGGYAGYTSYNIYGTYNPYGTFNSYGSGGYVGYAPGGYSSPFIAVSPVDNGAAAAQDPAWANYQYYSPPQYGQQPAQPQPGPTEQRMVISFKMFSISRRLCPIIAQGTCTDHVSCAGATLCISGQCQQMEPSQTRCTGDGECTGGGCKGGFCWHPPGASEPTTPPTPTTAAPPGAPGAGGPCSKQEDCSATQMCGGDGKCVNGFSIELKCSSDSDCDNKCKCKGGTCWMEGEPGKAKDGDPCKEHTECSLKSICEKGKCATAMPSTDKCVMDLMCGSGRVCKYFLCWKSLGNNLQNRMAGVITCRISGMIGGLIAHRVSVLVLPVSRSTNLRRGVLDDDEFILFEDRNGDGVILLRKLHCEICISEMEREKTMFQISLFLLVLWRIGAVKARLGHLPEKLYCPLSSAGILFLLGFYGYGGFGGYGGYGSYGGYNNPSPFFMVGPINYGDPTKDEAFNNYQYYQPVQYGNPQQGSQNANNVNQQTTTTTTIKPPDQAGGCSSHDSCSGSSLCMSGQCQQMEPTQTKCASDGDCPAGGGCKGLYCWQPPGAGGDNQPNPPAQTDTQPSGDKSGGPCKTQQECIATQMCDKKGQCVNGFSIEVQCSSDSDCGKENVCKGSTCWTKGDPGSRKDGEYCKEHTECSVKSICVDKKCTAAIPSLDKCVLDFMCKGKGRVCKYFHCWQSLGFFGPPGFADPGMFMGPYGYDPYGGYYAYDPYGGYPYPPFYYGYFPPGYPGGQNVQQGTGQGAQGPPGCSSHEECGGPNLCISGQCQPMEPTTTKCQSDSDCPQGGCKVGYCWQAPGTGGPMQPVQPGGGQGIANQTTGTGVGTPCAQQNDCAGDQMCGPDGKCVKGFSIEINCNSDSDCDKKNRCKGGTCWTQGEPGSGKDGDFCKQHTDCSVKSVCVKSKCTTALPSLDKCVIDLMCKGKGRVCKYFHCWKPIGSIGDFIKQNCVTCDCLPFPCSLYKWRHTWRTLQRQVKTRSHNLHISRNCSKTLFIGRPLRATNDLLQRFLPAGYAHSKHLFAYKKVSISRTLPLSHLLATDMQGAKAYMRPFGDDCLFQILVALIIWTACQTWSADTASVISLIMESMEGCSSHDDCPGAQICLQSNCKSASSKGAACWSDAQCAQGNEGCKFGFCWIARVSDEVVEVKESTSKPDISATCLDHAECSEAAICYEQQCRNAKPSEQPCITDTDCRPLQACKYEYCWSINDQGQLNENVKQPQCNRHEQCSLTKVCSSKDLVCVPAYPVGKVCSNAYDCDAFEECKEGICWRKGVETGKEENEECQFHSDCNGYTICFNYVCIPAMPTEIRCEDDTLCPHMASGCKYERCWIAIDEQETDSSMNEPVR
ncbi:hypothetical protein M514_07446 [Trichuris suis]|uniref:DUF7107 domain-containing protein n=1 Tax=Trichuris suis TaxID=68888 RepID=A0A085NCE4_9BILA|nr:hypothetical protein M514_07446 [Trichuris suis]